MAGTAPTNTAAVDFEKQQAAEADAKEAARQASLQKGQTLIDQIFNGSPVMGPKQYDWSTFKAPSTSPAAIMAQYQGGGMAATDPGSVPTGYTAVQIPGTPGKTIPGAATSAMSYGQSGGGRNQYGSDIVPIQSAADASSTTGGTPSTWGLKDASGKIYKPGDALTYQAPTGAMTGGFDDAFYNNYKQKVLDYYQPDEQRQYQQAQRDLTYNLARAGTLTSSTAGDKMGDLAYNDALQKANIVANANTQEGNLKNQIQSNKEDLINQLYATNDPTLTANLAESSARASQLQDPQLTPAANLFSPITVGATSALGGLGYGPVYGGTAYGQQPATNPAPASSAGTGSGVLKRYQ